MTAYALAHLRTPQINADVLDYIERIQATMDPYGGRFLVHGAPVEVREGSWPGTVVILEFPDIGSARAWYESPAYQQILPLRTAHIDGDTIIVDGVSGDYVRGPHRGRPTRSVAPARPGGTRNRSATGPTARYASNSAPESPRRRPRHERSRHGARFRRGAVEQSRQGPRRERFRGVRGRGAAMLDSYWYRPAPLLRTS